MATILWWILVPFYVIACLGLVVIVLLQKGKGVGFAGAFGVGSGSDTVFGPRTTQNLVHKLTYIGAGVFMSFAMIMALISGKVGRGSAPEMVVDTKAADTTALQEVLGETPPAVDNSAPLAATQAIQVPAPAAETPAPAAETPAPAAETPAPAAETPAPAAETPAPAAETPAPAAETPAPAAETPAAQ